jgi:hypothetical protein
MLYTPVHYIYLYYVSQNDDLGTRVGPIHQDGGSRIMLLLYLLYFKMSTQTYVQDLFNINLSHNIRDDTVSTYDTLILSLLLN